MRVNLHCTIIKWNGSFIVGNEYNNGIVTNATHSIWDIRTAQQPQRVWTIYMEFTMEIIFNCCCTILAHVLAHSILSIGSIRKFSTSGRHGTARSELFVCMCASLTMGIEFNCFRFNHRNNDHNKNQPDNRQSCTFLQISHS